MNTPTPIEPPEELTGPAHKWIARIQSANKVYEEWEKDYQCAVTEKYYLGHQWSQPTDSDGRMKYVINLCFPSVEIKMPALLFNKPNIEVVVRPGIEDDPQSNFDVESKMLRDLMLTCVTMEDSGFDDDIPLAVQETFYRFGAIEVGLSTESIENPNASPLDVPLPNDPKEDQPQLSLDYGPEEIPLVAPPVVPESPAEEQAELAPKPAVKVSQLVYYKHIPASQIRVSTFSRPRMRHADWIGYYEMVNCEDLKSNEYYDAAAREELEAGYAVKGHVSVDNEDREKARGMVKLWTIWDRRVKKKLVFADGKDKYLKEIDAPFVPLAILAFHPIMGSPYPLPPMFNWLGPQDELNETREMQRVHRRRMVRRYMTRKTAMTQADKDKLRSTEDALCIDVDDINNTIAPIPDAPLDRAVIANVPMTKDDFRNISGVSGEQTGEADSPTATQANIVNINSMSRDNYYKSKVAKWLGKIFRLTIAVLRTEAALPIWYKANIDTDSPMAMQEAALVFEAWKRINAKEITDLDFDVHVSIEALNDAGHLKERADWMTMLGTVFGPDAQTILAMSPPLLKKTLELHNIRNGKEIMAIGTAMAQLASMKAMAAAQAAGDKAGATPGTGAAGGSNTQTPPPGPNSQAGTDRQLDKQ